MSKCRDQSCAQIGMSKPYSLERIRCVLHVGHAPFGITFSKPIFCVLGFRPVAMSTTSSPSIASSLSSLLMYNVKLPSSFFSILVGVLWEWMFNPWTSYCSAMNFRHSSSNPLKGKGCSRHNCRDYNALCLKCQNTRAGVYCLQDSSLVHGVSCKAVTEQWQQHQGINILTVVAAAALSVHRMHTLQQQQQQQPAAGAVPLLEPHVYRSSWENGSSFGRQHRLAGLTCL